jgi:microcystin-dependent protein
MASVTGMTAEKIDELLGENVIAVEVDDNGQLIYTKRSGEQINAGSLTSSTAAVEQAWPVNSLFMSTVPTNPAVLLGIGTWARFGKGRTLVSLDEAQSEFDAVEETGGVKEVALTTQQIPSHTHTTPAHTHTTPAHTHTISASWYEDNVDSNGSSMRLDGWDFGSGHAQDRTGTTSSSGAGTTGEGGAGTTGATGGGAAHTNLPPYIVVYVWKRTA